MDEQLTRQLVKQLKILNIWISIFGTLILVVLIILGVLVFKIVMFVHETDQKITNISNQVKQSVDLKGQACNSTGLGDLLKSKTDACK